MVSQYESGGQYSVNQSQSYKIVTIKDRVPGATEKFTFRYVLKGADGERTVSLLSPLIEFVNTGIEFKYTVAPTLTAVAEAFGYRVSWPVVTTSTYPNYLYTEIYESKTLSNFTSAQLNNPAVTNMGTSQANSISKGTGTDLAKRYVKIRHVGYSNGVLAYSPLSSAVEVTPTDPVSQAIDATPPGEATGITAVWSGDNIVISATVDADSKRFVIKLQNGTNTPGYFYKFPVGTSTSQTLTITSQELYETFGTYYKSFSGVFQAADKVDNFNSGTAFTVATRANDLAGVTPSVTITAITNGYTVTWEAGKFARVYEGSSSSFTPAPANQVYGGYSPAIVKKTQYTKVYLKVIYYNDFGDASNTFTDTNGVTPIDSISADVQAPDSPASVTATAGLDSSGTIGFNGFLNISWPSVSDTSLRGYRIRFRPVTTPASEYSYVNSPGSGTIFRLGGLAAGATYEIGVAAYDEFNNTGSYTVIGTNVQVAGTPFIGTNVSTTGYFQAGVSGTDTGTFKFGYGVDTGKRGLVFNSSNYWYIDSAQTATLRIGGASSNYVYWNGTKLDIDGDLGVAGGTTIGGNISMKSGGSIYAGTLSGGNLASDGFLLGNSGLVIKKGAIQLRLDTSDGGIYAQYGQIAGWTIDSSKFERGSSGTYTGISSSGTYAFWAGSPSSGGAANSEFYVTPAGLVRANNISITGGSLTIGSKFSVASSDGKLIATGADITGEIKADTGRIGNVNIGSGALYIGDLSGNRVALTSGGFQIVNGGSTVISLSDSNALIGGWQIKSDNISSTGAYPFVIDSANKKIVFAEGAADTFEIDSSSSITTYSVSQYVDYGDSTYDPMYDAYYTDWSSSTSSASKQNTIQIKKSSAAGIQPMLTLSTQGGGIAQMSMKNGADESEVTLTSGGILFKTSKKGGIKIPGLANATAPHLNYSGAKAYVDGGYYSMPTGASTQTGRTLTIKSDGTLVPSRAFFKSASSESTITTGAYFSQVGRDGDIIFSTGT